jgi:hypothetical protein
MSVVIRTGNDLPMVLELRLIAVVWASTTVAGSTIVPLQAGRDRLLLSAASSNTTSPQAIYATTRTRMGLVAQKGRWSFYQCRTEDCSSTLVASKIHIYDVNSGKWYTQTATGDVPLARRQFCAGVTWPDDKSSFNIYLYGGYGFGNPPAFDDVYILSLPSFTWVKGYPLGGGDSNQFGHGGCSANVVNSNEMMIIGGWYSNTTFGDCDQPDAQGQHNMVLGNNTGKIDNGIWDKYDPKATAYAVPALVVAAIGGGYASMQVPMTEFR